MIQHATGHEGRDVSDFRTPRMVHYFKALNDIRSERLVSNKYDLADTAIKVGVGLHPYHPHHERRSV
jgi:hypothetical protein